MPNYCTVDRVLTRGIIWWKKIGLKGLKGFDNDPSKVFETHKHTLSSNDTSSVAKSICVRSHHRLNVAISTSSDQAAAKGISNV